MTTGEPALADLLASIPEELRTLRGRPFGRDETGAAIAHGSGRIVAGAVRYLQSVAGDRAELAIEPGVELAERAAVVARAREVVLDRLVAMLNAATTDDRYHVTAEYLLNESNNYSYEYRLFVAEYCRLLSGDPDFFFNQGRRSIPGSIVLLARPIGIRQTYAVLPRFTAKFVRTDLRVASTAEDSAVIRWYGGSQLAHLPPALHRRYLAYACPAYRGTFAAIPTLVAGLPMASIRQIHCQLDGADHCEWEFRWERPRRTRSVRAVAAGAGGSAAMLAYLSLRLPGWEALAVIGATLLPASLVFYGGDARRRARELRTQQQLLLEQRDLTEREYDRSERANAELQQINLELEQRVAELTTLNEIGVAASTTLDVDELLDRSLRAVVTHLRFDRALVLLADKRRGVLTDGRSIGATEEMQGVIERLELPIDHPHSQLAALYRGDGPMLVRDADQDPHGPNRELAQALAVRSFLGTPLVTKAVTVGILAVDNQLSGREIDPADGPLLFTVGNLIASTVENVRLYAEIEAQNRVLEERVEQRTEQLRRATAEAQEARLAAEAASETKSAFLANVSHELRTPLTSVVGFTKIVRKRLDEVVFPVVPADDPRVARAIRQVDENLAIMAAEGDRLTSMINDVLDLAKIEAGKLEWRSGPVDIGAVIERAAAATASLVQAAGLSLRVEVEPNLPELVGDRDRLIQVVINLLSNAVKFTAAGGIAVRARAAGSDTVVSVSDTGVGIAAADHDRVFEQFRQAGDTLTDKPRGTGLGLPISRQIVEHHGGRMWLESEPGAGSIFSFSLPISAAPSAGAGAGNGPETTEPAAAVPATPSRAATVPAAPVPAATDGTNRDRRAARERQRSVVVIEDDPATRALVRQALEPLAVLVAEAGSGEAGLRLVREHRPDLVVLDVVLPSEDGYDVARRIRADPTLGDVRILMATVLDDPDQAARAGADGHLTKPFDADRLAAEVRALLGEPAATA